MDGHDMSYMMSANDIMNVVGSTIPVLSTADLYKVTKLDDIFGGSDKALLLYQTNHNNTQRIGHWTGLLRNHDGVSFYDPYGTWPDDQYNNIPFDYRYQTNQTKRFLSRLLYNSSYVLHYSPHIHQMDDDGINTCGRHTALFLKLSLEPEKYNDFISILSLVSGMSADDIVTKITNNFL